MKFVRFIMKNAALANVPKHIDHFSKFSPSPLSMKQFLDFGELLFIIFNIGYSFLTFSAVVVVVVTVIFCLVIAVSY